MTLTRVVILGYYDKNNIGDDAFKTVFESILNPNLYQLDFVNPEPQLQEDPNWKLPSDTRCVIVGGGDLINDHFMPPIRQLLVGFKGSRLAIGVGISYPDCAAYLKCFDYVIVRSQEDYEMAKNYVASGFLECMPDLTYFLDRKNVLKPKAAPLSISTTVDATAAADQSMTIRIGLCIAEPCLATAHEHGEKILVDLANVMVKLTQQLQLRGFKAEYIFIPFNTNTEHVEECDLFAIQRMQKIIESVNSKKKNCEPMISTQVLDDSLLKDPIKIFDFFKEKIDFVLGMRYHSILFSMLTRTPFVALYSTPKIRNLLKYVGISGSESDHPMEYYNESTHVPLRFDINKLIADILTVMEQQPRKTRFFAQNQVAYAAKIRKLIKSNAQFPTIEPDIGYEIKFLDEHHRNRLTMGTLHEFAQTAVPFLTGNVQDLDAILDGVQPFQSMLPADVAPEQVAKDLCRILFARLHLKFFTHDTMDKLSANTDISIDESGYLIYIDGFAEKIFSTDVSLRKQLDWIISDYYRGLHPTVTHFTWS